MNNELLFFWLQKLISYNTVSCFSNLELIYYCKDYLEQNKFNCKLFYNDDKTKANLLASIGPTNIPGIVLSGHTDVVPITGQKWDTNPFELIKTNNKLYGRGTCDMKGFIAVCMAYSKQLSEIELSIPIYFAFSYDEEIGCKGVISMCDYISKLSIKPLCCFVGEPTMMKVIRKHKGMRYFKCMIKGSECHSSTPHQGTNAVEFASEIVSKMRSMKRIKQTKGPFEEQFEPPYTTIHCGVINGGVGHHNLVPKYCCLQGEFRFIPKDNPDEIFQELVDYSKELEKEMTNIDVGITFETLASGPALDTPLDSIAVTLGKEFSGSTQIELVSYMTEAGTFSNAGVPTVVIGPGSIEQAHKPNEYVSIEQMKLCENFMEKIIQYAKK